MGSFKATFVYTTSMLKRAAPVMLILRKAALGAVPLQIRSFAACADPLTKKKNPRKTCRHKRWERHTRAMTDMRIRVSLKESHPNTCSSNHAIVRAVHGSLGTSI